MLSKIKKQYLNKRLAFGDSGDMLGNRNDIDQLAIIAHQSGDSSLIELFEILPPLADLKKVITDAELKELKKVPLVAEQKVAEKTEGNNPLNHASASHAPKRSRKVKK